MTKTIDTIETIETTTRRRVLLAAFLLVAGTPLGARAVDEGATPDRQAAPARTAETSRPQGSASVGRFTLGVEAMAWWLQKSPIPIPLVTDGFLGDAGTNVLLGNEKLDTGTHGGFRVTVAYAASERLGFEGSGFYASSRSTSRGVTSPGTLGSKDILLSFFDVTHGAESYTELSFSPLYAGSAQEEVTNSLGGAEVNATWALPGGDCTRLQLLGGFRALRFRERFAFTTSSPYVPPEPLDVWTTSDEFDARSDFYGLQVGARARFGNGPLFGTVSAKVALGAVSQHLDVKGGLVTNDFTALKAEQTFAGGYFALPSNLGTISRTSFAAVPELELDLGYRLGSSMTFSAGYTLLYVSNVIRPAEQIDRSIDPTQSVAYTYDPTATRTSQVRPAAGLRGTGLLAQSVRAGLSFRF